MSTKDWPNEMRTYKTASSGSIKQEQMHQINRVTFTGVNLRHFSKSDVIADTKTNATAERCDNNSDMYGNTTDRRTEIQTDGHTDRQVEGQTVTDRRQRNRQTGKQRYRQTDRQDEERQPDTCAIQKPLATEPSRRLLHLFGTVCRSQYAHRRHCKFFAADWRPSFCPVVQLLWLRASHCTDYHGTSLLFLRVKCKS